MQWQQYRFGKGDDSTLSTLYHDDVFECFMLEDELRSVKVAGETAIPAGRYEIKIRGNGGRLNPVYYEKYPWHEGMLHLQDVPGFTWCYVHIGNKEKDTDGCPLPGDVPQVFPDGEFSVGRSAVPYERIYKKVIAALHRNERVFWEIFDDARHIVTGVYDK